MSSKKLIEILIIMVLIVQSSCNYANKRTEMSISNKAFSNMMNTFIKHFQKNPREAFLLMKENIKLRINFENMLKQRI
jgi:ABC-type phosphate/phosphonate transport system permease subunit